jgi:hypothetical protein
VSRDAALSGFAESAQFPFNRFETRDEISLGNDLQVFGEVTLSSNLLFSKPQKSFNEES